jgi:hypothetical protein
MSSFLSKLLRLVECLGLAVLISFLTFASLGGFYEAATGSPSDGFNFTLLLFGSPVFLLLVIALTLAAWRNLRVKRVCWWLVLSLLGMIVVIRLLQ